MDITNEPALEAEPITMPMPLPPERPEAAPAAPPSAPRPPPATLPPPAYAARPAWWNGTEAAAASAGVNSDTLWKIAGIESSFGRSMGTAAGSSASGPFQITNDTWNGIARLNPSLGLTNKADLSQHGRAAAALLRANTAVLRNALGREPTDGEQYLTWFGGIGAGPKVATAPADTPVTAIFSPAAIAANRSILGNGMTVGGLRRWADAKMAGQHYIPQASDTAPAVDPMSNPAGGVGWNTLAPSMPYSEAEKAIRADRQNADVWSNTHAMAEAFDHENMVGQLWRAANVPTPDPSYTPTVAGITADPRARDIDKTHYAYLLQSQSDAEMGQRIENLKDELNYQQKMAQKGWGGPLMQTVASLWDPAGVAMGMLSPVGAAAAKYGRIARIIGAGAEGAAIGTGMEGLAPKPGEVDRSYLAAAGMGFLGGVAGASVGEGAHAAWHGMFMQPHPDNVPAFKTMGRAAQSMVDDIAAGSTGNLNAAANSSAGAAQNLGLVEPIRSDTDLFANSLFQRQELGKAALTNLGVIPTRFDIAGQTKASANPLTAALGSRFVEDAVGNADHSAVNRAVSVERTLIQNREETFAARAYQDAWNDYSARNSIPVFKRDAARLEFNERAADAIDNLDPTQAHDIDPAVQKVADTYRRFFADYHELAQNPGLLDGSEMRPVRGMENVPSDPNYFPRIYDTMAFGEHVRQFGDGEMQRLLRESAMSVNPDLSQDDAAALARGLYKGLRNAQVGSEVSMGRMLSGEDQDGLRSFLGAETDMSREQVDRIIGLLNPPSETGTIARTKRRTPLNVHYEAQLRDRTTGEMVPVKVKDFTERNVVHVATMYGRQMSAQVALARLRIENPIFREPEMVPKPYGPAEHLNDPATGKAFIHEIGPERTNSDGERYSRGAIYPEGVDKEAFLEGGLRYRKDAEGNYTVKSSGLPENLRGKGTGIAMYRMLAEQAQREGKTIRSDKDLTADSARVWEKLKKEGFDIQTAKETVAGVHEPVPHPKDRLAPIPRDEKWTMPASELDEHGDLIHADLNPLRRAMKQLHTEAEHAQNLPANLEDVRKVLGNYTRAEQDRMFLGAIHSDDLSLSQISDNKALTASIKAAAYSPAGKPFHLLRRQGDYHGDFSPRPESGPDGSFSNPTGEAIHTITPKPREMVREAEDPANPRYLVDGIRSPSDMAKVIAQVKSTGDALNIDPMKTGKDVERLQFMYDAITGSANDSLSRGKLGQFIRLLKAFNYVRVMNQVGFSQFGEIMHAVSQVGWKAAKANIPELRQFFDGIRGGRDQTDFARHLEHAFDAGTEQLRGSMHIPLDDLGNRVGNGSSFMDKAERLLAKGTRLTSMVSGMAPITAWQQKLVANAIVSRFAMDATGEMGLNMKRMAVLGIDPEMRAKIAANMRDHAGYFEGERGTDLHALNLDKWDPDARHAFEYAGHLWVRKMIQENDLGQMNTVLGTSMGRLMGQFRMFMMAGYTKNTLHSLHMRDWEAVSGVLGSTAMAGLTYAARTYLNSIGRSDQQQYLAKHLDEKSIVTSAIQGGAFSSIFPMFADVGTYIGGFDPLFTSRVSGTPAQGFTSNPTASLVDNILKAGHGISATVRGQGAYNRQDAQALEQVLPFSNFLPVVWTANALMSGLPTQDTHRTYH